jgi:uncharacterized membrane protein
MRKFLAFLMFVSLVFPFSIESYDSRATILENGDLEVYETMAFELEQQYNEGYRSIRPQDVGTLGNLQVHNVKLNGRAINHYTQENNGYYEIVWTETVKGTNVVELDYTLKDRVELWDDYAKLCYEHFSANWAVPAKQFQARMTMPERSRGKELHFEVYSQKKGAAYIDDLTVVIEMDNVPSGNYVGGCYVFARDSVQTSKTVNGSAYEILQKEREIYGSEEVLSPEDVVPFEVYCLPVLIILLLAALVAFFKRKKYPAYPESILPPGKDEPAVVSALLRNRAPERDLLPATILELINRGVIDIVELERKGETSETVRRERTVLMLKDRKGLRPHEQAVVDMIFSEGSEVDLDEMVKGYRKITKQSEAKKHPASKNLEVFRKELKNLLKEEGMKELSEKYNHKMAVTAVAVGVSVWLAIVLSAFFMVETIDVYLAEGETWRLAFLAIEMLGILASVVLLVSCYMRPVVPEKLADRYAKWKSFKDAVESSRLKEYPPASVSIWGSILVYATALGMAGKVKKHLSELDELTRSRMESMQRVRRSSYAYYGYALALSNLSRTGMRSGFSGRSSGGWSGGGGGFSGGSSGGGGFR